MLLKADNIRIKHINSITHEGKVVVVATDDTGKLWYTIKQDGFETSYMETASKIPEDQRTGWEDWQALPLPKEAIADQSVLDKERDEYFARPISRNILNSRYKTDTDTLVAPVQLVSGFGHVYVFRQTKTSQTLLVDRFVLDGMTNTLNPRLDVRFKRSRQKYKPLQSMGADKDGLRNIDALDFQDANGQPFYEPSTELSIITSACNGWFAVVLVPTIEEDVWRWHIFSHDIYSGNVNLTTVRASEEGLFALRDLTVMDERAGELIPRSIPGVIKRRLELKPTLTTINGIAATLYYEQREKENDTGIKQLMRDNARVMLAVATDKGIASIDFAVGGDGLLSCLGKNPAFTLSSLRDKRREVLLPLDLLGNIKSYSDRSPLPQGLVTALREGGDDTEGMIEIVTNQEDTGLERDDLVRLSDTSALQGTYRISKVDDAVFEIIPQPAKTDLGRWEKVEDAEGGLAFDGMITAYEIVNGKLRVTCPEHGFANGDEVQITGGGEYNSTYAVQTADGKSFFIESPWVEGEAISIRSLQNKRQGVLLDGINDYFEVSAHANPANAITVSCWAKSQTANWNAPACLVSKRDAYVLHPWAGRKIIQFFVFVNNRWVSADFNMTTAITDWHHYCGTYDGNTIRLFVDGVEKSQVACAGKINADTSKSLTIGKDNVNPWYFNGGIADVQVWDVAQSAETIRQNMFLNLTGRETGLTGYWRLEDMYEGQAMDASSNRRHAQVRGNPTLGSVTLNRKNTQGDIVKYKNLEYFPVTGLAVYEESFLFRVNGGSAINLVSLNNADTRIFSFAYWGKTSPDAEVETPVEVQQPAFSDAGSGWFKASCRVKIPEGIGLLRQFGLDRIKGNWTSLDLRNHKMEALSDVISLAEYIEPVSLNAVGESQSGLLEKLCNLSLGESNETDLLKEKKALQKQIADFDNKSTINTQITAQQGKVTTLTNQSGSLKTAWDNEVTNKFNYLCKIKAVRAGRLLTIDRNNTGGMAFILYDRNENDQYWQFIKQANGSFIIKNQHTGRVVRRAPAAGSAFRGNELAVYADENSSDTAQQWTLPVTTNGYRITNADKSLNLYNDKTGDWAEVIVYPAGDEFTIDKTALVADDSDNGPIKKAKKAYDDNATTLAAANTELQRLIGIRDADATKRQEWANRIAEIDTALTAIQTQNNTYQTELVRSLGSASAQQFSMTAFPKDDREQESRGALLAFAEAGSRVHMLDTCEGNVQLDYFDRQGRMRQTRYDATLDSANTLFRQWMGDAMRLAYNCASTASKVTLNTALPLPTPWSIEAWFV